MLELGYVFDSAVNEPLIVFNIKTAEQGNIKLTVDLANLEKASKTISSLAEAVGLTDIIETSDTHNIPFLIQRGEGGRLSMLKLITANEKLLDSSALLWAVDVERLGPCLRNLLLFSWASCARCSFITLVLPCILTPNMTLKLSGLSKQRQRQGARIAYFDRTTGQ